MKIFSRERWGSRSTNPEGHQDPSNIKEIFLHWTESATGQMNFASQSSAMKGLQSYHMDSNGWSDIGYHYVVFQSPKGKPWIPPRVYEGRELTCVPAAQMNHNTNTCAIAVVMRDGEKLQLRTQAFLKRFIKFVQKSKIGHTTAVRPHKAVVETNCPGPQLSAFIEKNY